MGQGQDRTRDPWICSQLASVDRHVTHCATQPGDKCCKIFLHCLREEGYSFYMNAIYMNYLVLFGFLKKHHNMKVLSAENVKLLF